MATIMRTQGRYPERECTVDYDRYHAVCPTLTVTEEALAPTSDFVIPVMSSSHADLSPLGTAHFVAASRRIRHPEYRRRHLRLEMAETVARFLIGYRQKRGLTQAQLGVRLEMEESAVSRLESGDHVPNADTLQRIREGCGAEVTFAIVERP